MNLNDLTEDIARNINQPKKHVALVLKEMIEVITVKLKQGENVSIPKLGIFSVKHIDARKCRNPMTGEKITTSAHYAPKFKISSTIKKALL